MTTSQDDVTVRYLKWELFAPSVGGGIAATRSLKAPEVLWALLASGFSLPDFLPLPFLPFGTPRILTGVSGFIRQLFQASFLQTEKKK